MFIVAKKFLIINSKINKLNKINRGKKVLGHFGVVHLSQRKKNDYKLLIILS